ncbi:MAG: hypothetical protein JOY61_08755 [Chloroflexi bacterium]|nr:hypothetical protein [Chloroflexota bacterium]
MATRRAVWRCPICETTLTILPLPISERQGRSLDESPDMRPPLAHLQNQHRHGDLAIAVLDYWVRLHRIVQLVQRAESGAPDIDGVPAQPYVYAYQIKEALGVSHA